jgi:NAD-reducing hydrogenase large subunit
VIQSHALSFFYLSGPDLVLGHDADPARRTILGLAEAAPALARDGVRLRRFGQEVIERVAGRRVHAAYAIPGGVARPLEAAARDAIAADLPAALEAAERTLAWWEEAEGGHADEAEGSRQETAFLCLAGPAGELSVDGGLLRVVAPSGERIADEVDPATYADLLDEESEPWTYLRPARLRGAAGDGAFRVGPLARLNAVARCGTPRADRALARFRALAPGPVPSTFHAHRARLVEILWGLERIAELLSEPALLDREVLAPPGEGRPEGVGACEAPRGTLIHHYRVDADGLVAWANLVVPTAENGRAMERAVLRIADRWLSGARITPALLNRVEAGIRAFDPCLSCSTHAVGERSVALRLVGPGGRVLDEAGSD